MSYFHFKIFQKDYKPLRNFKKKQGRWPFTSCPSCLEDPAAKNLSLPHGSPTDTSRQEGHIPSRAPEEENDAKGCETRPSIYYRPKSIYKAVTQLVRKHYPHSTTLLFLCFYVGHSTEKSTEDLPGKIWKLQLRIVDPTFLLELSHEGKGETTGSSKPRLRDFTDKKTFFKRIRKLTHGC